MFNVFNINLYRTLFTVGPKHFFIVNDERGGCVKIFHLMTRLGNLRHRPMNEQLPFDNVKIMTKYSHSNELG